MAFLQEFIRAHPESSRWKLSRQLCEALGWREANGALRDVVCRGLLLMLERPGQIELTPVGWRIRGQCWSERQRPEALLIDTKPLAMPLRFWPATKDDENVSGRRVRPPLIDFSAQHPARDGVHEDP